MLRQISLLSLRPERHLPRARGIAFARKHRQPVSRGLRAETLHTRQRRQRARQALLHALHRRARASARHEGQREGIGQDPRLQAHAPRPAKGSLGEDIPRQPNREARGEATLLDPERRRPHPGLASEPGGGDGALLHRRSALRPAERRGLHRLPVALPASRLAQHDLELHRGACATTAPSSTTP